MAIPRVIHQFWDRLTPPDDIAERMQSWRDKHPAWEYRLWHDDTASDFLAERFGRNAVLCFRAAKLPAMRADIARLALMVAAGGLYADADMISRQPLDDLTEAMAVVRVEPGKRTGKAKLNNNFMASEPGVKLFALAFEQALRNVRNGAFRLDVTRLTGPLLLTGIWWKKLTEDERKAYRIIDQEAFRQIVGGAAQSLGHHRDGSHWLAEVRRRQIIDLGLARDWLVQPADASTAPDDKSR